MTDARGNSVPNSRMTSFDTYSHGFDLPASVQLNRVNRKLHRWEKAQENINERQLEREQQVKSWVKKEEKIQNRIKKTKEQEKKNKKEELD